MPIGAEVDSSMDKITVTLPVLLSYLCIVFSRKKLLPPIKILKNFNVVNNLILKFLYCSFKMKLFWAIKL